MQTENRFLDDLARVATGALDTMQGARRELETMVRQRIERYLAGLELVSREEFDVVKAMAEEARLENETLAKKIEALERKAGKSTDRAVDKAPTRRRARSSTRTKNPAPSKASPGAGTQDT